MTRLLRSTAVATTLMLSLPALAETPQDEGFSLMEEGAKLLMRGLMAEMEPTLDEMGQALSDAKPMLEGLGPQFAELLSVMGDLRNYQAPEVLENGDILIRRKAPLPAEPKADPAPNGETEL